MGEIVPLAEKGLLITFIIVASLFILGTGSMSSESARIPLIFGMLVIILSFILLIRGYLPEKWREVLVSSGIERETTDIDNQK